jgi:ribosomal protein S27AE
MATLNRPKVVGEIACPECGKTVALVARTGCKCLLCGTSPVLADHMGTRKSDIDGGLCFGSGHAVPKTSRDLV